MDRIDKAIEYLKKLGFRESSYPYYDYDLSDYIIEVDYHGKWKGNVYKLDSIGREDLLFKFDAMTKSNFNKLFRMLNQIDMIGKTITKYEN